MGAPGVAGQVGDRRQLCRGHRRGLERQKSGWSGHAVTSRGDRLTQTRSPLAAGQMDLSTLATCRVVARICKGVDSRGEE